MHQQRQSWFAKNWWWSIPSCCLGCLVLVAGGCVLLVGGTWTAIRTAAPIEEALDRARAHPAVVEALGEPIERGWQMQVDVSASPDGRVAELSIPLHGPRGEATLRAEAHWSDGAWVFDVLTVTGDDGTTIDLLAAPEPRPSSEV